MNFKVCWSCARIYHTKPKCNENCGDGGYMMACFPWRALTDKKSELAKMYIRQLYQDFLKKLMKGDNHILFTLLYPLIILCAFFTLIIWRRK